jgi:hypothetical protein
MTGWFLVIFPPGICRFSLKRPRELGEGNTNISSKFPAAAGQSLCRDPVKTIPDKFFFQQQESN